MYFQGRRDLELLYEAIWELFVGLAFQRVLVSPTCVISSSGTSRREKNESSKQANPLNQVNGR